MNNYLLEDSCFGGYFTQPLIDNEAIMGCIGSNNVTKIRRLTATTSQVGLNSSNTDVGAIGEGLTILERDLSNPQPNRIRKWENGVNLSDGLAAATSIPTEDIYLGCQNNEGATSAFYSGTISVFIVGASNGVDQGKLYNIILELLIDLGVFTNELIDSFPNPLAPGEEDIIRNTVHSMVRDGSWQKLDSFACFALADPVNALWDWKRLTGMTNNGAVHGANGYSFNGVDQYIDSGYNPTNSSLASSSDLMQGVFLKQDAGTTDGALCGSINTSINFFFIQFAGSRTDLIARNLSALNLSFGLDNINDSFYSDVRSGSNSISAYKNGLEVDSDVSTTIGDLSARLFIGARSNLNTAERFFEGTISTFLAGAAIGVDQGKLYNIIQQLLTDLGVFTPSKSDLVSYYKLDEAAGNAIDSHGTNDGTQIGTPTLNQAGLINTAWLFNGSTDAINIDSILADVATDNQGTISMWVKGTNDDAQSAFCIGDSSSANALIIYVGNNITGTLTNELITIGHLDTSGGGNNILGYTTSTRTELFDGEWHHICIISNGSDYTLYLDSNEKTLTVGAGSDNGDWLNDLTGLDVGRIGCRNYNSLGNDRFFNGEIDEVAIWSRPLSQFEILELYNNGVGFPYDDFLP